jgi:hypothetical protein
MINEPLHEFKEDSRGPKNLPGCRLEAKSKKGRSLRNLQISIMSHISSSDFALLPEAEQTRLLFLELPIEAIQTYYSRTKHLSFPQFGELPQELRLKIWACTVPPPRIWISYCDCCLTLYWSPSDIAALFEAEDEANGGVYGGIYLGPLEEIYKHKLAAMSFSQESRAEMILRCPQYIQNSWDGTVRSMGILAAVDLARYFDPNNDILFVTRECMVEAHLTYQSWGSLSYGDFNKVPNLEGLQQLAIGMCFFQTLTDGLLEAITCTWPNLKELLVTLDHPYWSFRENQSLRRPFEFVDLPSDRALDYDTPMLKKGATVRQWEESILKNFENLRGLCCNQLRRLAMDGFHGYTPPKYALEMHPKASCRAKWKPPRVRIVQFKKMPVSAPTARVQDCL